MPGSAPLRAKTIDISLGGVSLIVADQLPLGQICTIAFEAPLGDNIARVTAVARVIYSILTGTEGFRIGMQIIEIDAPNNKTLAELMV